MEITHHFGGGVYVKETRFKAGEYGEKHVHTFDHLSTLVSGLVQLEIDGVSRFLMGPQVLTIEANKSHKVIAVTDVVWHCTHATDCTDPYRVDDALTGGN